MTKKEKMRFIVRYEHLHPAAQKLFDAVQEKKREAKIDAVGALIMGGASAAGAATAHNLLMFSSAGMAGGLTLYTARDLKMSKEEVKKLEKRIRLNGFGGILSEESIKRESMEGLKEKLDKLRWTPKFKIKARGQKRKKKDTRRFVIEHKELRA